MGTLFYSTGKAGRELGVSQERIRDLCAAGAIEAEVTAGGQWRIGKATVEGLKRDGLPPLPRPLPGDNLRSAANPRCGSGALLAPPSEQVIEAAEEVVLLENEVKSLGLRQRKEEALDWFRSRERDEAEQLAAEEREERERLVSEETWRQREESLLSHEAYAMSLTPVGAPPELSLQIQAAVRDRLLSLSPMPAPPVIQRIVESLVARALAPWLHEQDIMAVLIEARDRMLPAGARGSGGQISPWQSRVIWAAAAGIRELRDDASSEEIRSAARLAVAKVAAEFAHAQACQKMAGWVFLPGTSEEDDQARAAVKEALAQLPVGASEKQMQAARDAAMQPIRDAITQRQAQAQTEQQQRQAEAEAARQRIQDAANRQDLCRLGPWVLPWDFPADQKPPATAAVARALDALPAGAPQHELEQARAAALGPFIAAHAQRRRKERVIAAALLEIHPALIKLERDWQYGRDTPETLAERFRAPIRAALEKRLSGDEPREQLSKLVRQLVLHELNATPAPARAR